MRTRYLHFRPFPSAMLIFFSASLLYGIAFAEPPEITSFSFDIASQKIAFQANSGGKICSFEITSTSPNTTFLGGPTGFFTGDAGGTEWYITPGDSPECEEHHFTITVTNADGTDQRTMCLHVRGEKGRSTSYEFCVSGIPTLGEWGIIIFVLLLFAWMVRMIIRRMRTATVGL